jgi:hypothetical protein
MGNNGYGGYDPGALMDYNLYWAFTGPISQSGTVGADCDANCAADFAAEEAATTDAMVSGSNPQMLTPFGSSFMAATGMYDPFAFGFLVGSLTQAAANSDLNQEAGCGDGTLNCFVGAGALLSSGLVLGSPDAGVVVNLGGEGEWAGAVNVQPGFVLDWGGTMSSGQTVNELQAAGNQVVIANNLTLPFADGSVDIVVTNNVPLNINTGYGPGIPTSEIQRILAPGGTWFNNGAITGLP